METDIEEMAEELTRTRRLLNALIDVLEVRDVIGRTDLLTAFEQYPQHPDNVSERLEYIRDKRN